MSPALQFVRVTVKHSTSLLRKDQKSPFTQKEADGSLYLRLELLVWIRLVLWKESFDSTRQKSKLIMLPLSLTTFASTPASTDCAGAQ